MNSLGQRTNVIVKKSNKKPIVIYEDHRYYVFVLWHAAFCSKLITPPVNVVYFDKHDDFKELTSPAKQKFASLAGEPNERKVLEIIEWDLSPDDGDWLRAAMELGLVGDAILVGVESTTNLQSATKHHQATYQSSDQKQHTVFSVGHLWDALAHQGCLSDCAYSKELKSIWEALGWHPRGYPDGFSDKTADARQVLLDFDLDCFSHNPFEGTRTRSWPEEDFVELFYKRSTATYTTDWSARDFVLELAKRSPIITIAKESSYCGGMSESQRIFEMVREHLLIPALGEIGGS